MMNLLHPSYFSTFQWIDERQPQCENVVVFARSMKRSRLSRHVPARIPNRGFPRYGTSTQYVVPFNNHIFIVIIWPIYFQVEILRTAIEYINTLERMLKSHGKYTQIMKNNEGEILLLIPFLLSQLSIGCEHVWFRSSSCRDGRQSRIPCDFLIPFSILWWKQPTVRRSRWRFWKWRRRYARWYDLIPIVFSH